MFQETSGQMVVILNLMLSHATVKEAVCATVAMSVPAGSETLKAGKWFPTVTATFGLSKLIDGLHRCQ